MSGSELNSETRVETLWIFSAVLKPSVPLFFFSKNPEAVLISLAAAPFPTPSFPPLSSPPVCVGVWVLF